MLKRLSIMRKQLGFKTQKEFASALEIPWRTLQVYEQGVSQMPSSFLLKLQEKFLISIDWLFTGEGDMFIQFTSSKITFKNSELILKNLNTSEIASALTIAYIQKIVDPLIRDANNEKIFWIQLLEGHKNQISSLFYFFQSLIKMDSDKISLQNAKKMLLDLLNHHIVFLIERCNFMIPNKDVLIQIISDADNLGCYIIFTNAQKILVSLNDLLEVEGSDK